MKINFRIPTKHTYAYVEFEADINPDEAKQFYDEKYKEFNSDNSKELDRKKWNEVLDDYLHKNQISVEDYEAMSDTQKAMIQEVKKSKARLKDK